METSSFSAVPDPAPAVEQPFRFHASGSEYFRIWIVNLLLTIVTLGIYSAWAKVRRNRYFYASTELAGSTFEYHGNPVAILKGRIIALVVFGAYNLALRTSPLAGGLMALVMAGLMPWFIWKSFQFQLYNTSYRGIRFGFDGSAREAYKRYLWWPILNGLTLGLLTPLVHQRLKAFQHNESRYGTARFSFDASARDFYKMYAVFLVVGGGGLALLVWLVFHNLPSLTAGMEQKQRINAMTGLAMVAIYGWLFLVFPLFFNMLQNLIWNHTSLGLHRFKSEMKWGRMIFIVLTNYLAVICTLGLFMPFARVRAMRYRLESTTLLAHGSLDDFVAATGEQVTATGIGMTDIMDFDFSM